MNSLQFLQYQMLRAVLADHAATMTGIEGDRLATAVKRLEVYRHGYRMRLRESLRADYPGLALLTGGRFDALMDQYILARPPSHYNIRDHGRFLPAFLAQHHPWSTRLQLGQMAGLDRAITLAFDGPDEPLLTQDALSSIATEDWPMLRLALAAHVHCVAISCNVDRLRRAVGAAHERPRLRRYAHARHLLVWRQAMTVRFRSLSPLEHAVIEGIRENASIAQLCELAGGRRGGGVHLARRIAHTLATLVAAECLLAANVD